MLLGLLGILVILQFFQIEKTNPTADPAQDYLAVAKPPGEVAPLIKQACYDCHSYNTTYPWYTYTQPTGWWIKHHIDEGREHLNFAVWTTYEPKRAAHKLEECFEVIESMEMPMKSYTWMHPEAKLTTAQRQLLVDWFKSEYNAAEQASPSESSNHSTESSEHEQEETHESEKHE